MSWGMALGQAYSSVSGGIKDAALNTVSSIQNAAGAVRRTIAAAAQGGANVAGFGARAIGDTASAMGRAGMHIADKSMAATPVLGRSYIAAKNLLLQTKTPRATSGPSLAQSRSKANCNASRHARP